MQRGYTFKEVLHLTTAVFVKYGQWAWKTTSKLFAIQFIKIDLWSCFFVVVVVVAVDVVLTLKGVE